MSDPSWKSNYPELSRQLMTLLILRSTPEQSQAANDLCANLQSTYGNDQITYASHRLQLEFDRDGKVERDKQKHEMSLRAARIAYGLYDYDPLDPLPALTNK